MSKIWSIPSYRGRHHEEIQDKILIVKDNELNKLTMTIILRCIGTKVPRKGKNIGALAESEPHCVEDSTVMNLQSHNFVYEQQTVESFG